MSWHSPFSSHHFKEGPSVVRNYYQLDVLEACQLLNSVWQTLSLKDLSSVTQFDTFPMLSTLKHLTFWLFDAHPLFQSVLHYISIGQVLGLRLQYCLKNFNIKPHPTLSNACLHLKIGSFRNQPHLQFQPVLQYGSIGQAAEINILILRIQI